MSNPANENGNIVDEFEEAFHVSIKSVFLSFLVCYCTESKILTYMVLLLDKEDELFYKYP